MSSFPVLKFPREKLSLYSIDNIKIEFSHPQKNQDETKNFKLQTHFLLHTS
jgi:hypothetical protein